MPVFKLHVDALYPAWYRDYYTIEAETEEEAVQMIKDYEVDPDESEPLFEFEQEAEPHQKTQEPEIKPTAPERHGLSGAIFYQSFAENHFTRLFSLLGVNGAGKTTSIGKISNRLRAEGKKVVVAAADTFRAAAIDQLAEWCKRADVELVKQTEGSDPAAVVYDAANYARNRGADVLIVDTAGRLHNKKNLMNELAKINRVIDKQLPGASRETLLVLDSTTGQNAVNQAKEFRNTSEITGLVLTKLDGTAKGGIILAIKRELGIPVKFIGVGEQIDELQPFEPSEFVDALFE